MTIYYATIRHHSISRAPIIKIEGTLIQAKRKTTHEFGDGFNDHILTIFGSTPDGEIDRNWIISTRRISSTCWQDLI